MPSRQFCIIDKFKDLESCFNAGYNGAKFDVRGYYTNTTCSFDVTLTNDMTITHPICATFEHVQDNIILYVKDKNRKFLLTAILMYKPLEGSVYILNIPPTLMQTPTQTLTLMKQQLNSLLILNEITDNEIRSLERHLQQTQRLERAQTAVNHARYIIALNVPKVCPHCFREEKRVTCLRCNKPSLCATCFTRRVQCYLCSYLQ